MIQPALPPKHQFRSPNRSVGNDRQASLSVADLSGVFSSEESLEFGVGSFLGLIHGALELECDKACSVGDAKNVPNESLIVCANIRTFHRSI